MSSGGSGSGWSGSDDEATDWFGGGGSSSSGTSGTSGTSQSSGSSASSSSSSGGGGGGAVCCIAIPGHEGTPTLIASDMAVLRVIAIDGDGNEAICEIDLCAVESGSEPHQQQFCPPDGDVVRPAILTMQYIATSCEDESHSQDPGTVYCDEFVLDLPETAWIIGSNSQDPYSGSVWCEGWVTKGNVFDVAASHAGQPRLTETTFIHVLDGPDGAVLQTTGLHTSCSQPLDFGDRFGASRIVDVVDDLSASGDVNLDGTVNFKDLMRVLAAWGSCDGCFEDIDSDGAVNFRDVQVILANWTG
ncbi:MAG: hypothetical protein GY715_12390 [Planctomycetes bacterium]|nr:hypothetical protein [Planctomycetota bacterium]